MDHPGGDIEWAAGNTKGLELREEVVMGVQKMSALNCGGSHGSGWEVRLGRRLIA